MPTITISRSFGSYGDQIARLLCDRLDYLYFDKDLMMRLAVQTGLPVRSSARLVKEPRQALTTLERMMERNAVRMSHPLIWAAAANADAQEQLIADQVRQIILAAYEESNVIIVGRGGQCPLREFSEVLHIRIVAPLELRIQRHARQAGITLAEARQVVLERDRALASYVKRFYDEDPANLELYDLVINTGRVKHSLAVEVIIKAVETLTSQH